MNSQQVPTTSLTASTQATEGTQAELSAFFSAWNEAMIAADATKLGEMMDDAIVLVHITGRKQTKQEWLSDVRARRMAYQHIDVRRLDIQLTDAETARLTFSNAVTANIYGAQGTWTINGTMELAQRQGKWIRIK